MGVSPPIATTRANLSHPMENNPLNGLTVIPLANSLFHPFFQHLNVSNPCATISLNPVSFTLPTLLLYSYESKVTTIWKTPSGLVVTES